MSTHILMTGVFPIPTLSPMNGPGLNAQFLSDYLDIVELDGGESIPMMAGVAVEYPEVQAMYSEKAVGFRTAEGWEIYLPQEGIKLTADALISEGSITQSAVVMKPGTPTFFEGEGGGSVSVPPFWTNFLGTSEDDFGGNQGGGSWVPETPPRFDGIYPPIEVTTVYDEGWYFWEQAPTPEPTIIVLDASQENGGVLAVGVTFGNYEHGEPLYLTLSSPSFATKVLPFDGTDGESRYYFFDAGFDLDGILNEAGTAVITVVVTFA